MVLYTTNSFSQKDITFLKGLVVNDTIDVGNVTITNKNLKVSTTSNELGVFEIPVRLKDSILISAIHLKDFSLLINQEILDKRGIEIAVISEVNNMDAVVLNNILSKSATSFNVGPTTNPDLFRMRKDELRHLSNTDPTRNFQGVNIIGGISAIAKLLKGKNKDKEIPLTMSQKYQRWLSFKPAFVKEFGITFFTESLKIPESIIDQFLLYCKTKKDIASMYFEGNKLELIEFLVRQSKIYNGQHIKE